MLHVNSGTDADVKELLKHVETLGKSASEINADLQVIEAGKAAAADVLALEGAHSVSERVAEACANHTTWTQGQIEQLRQQESRNQNIVAIEAHSLGQRFDRLMDRLEEIKRAHPELLGTLDLPSRSIAQDSTVAIETLLPEYATFAQQHVGVTSLPGWPHERSAELTSARSDDRSNTA